MNSVQPRPLPLSAIELNRTCACRTLDPERLRAELEAEPSLRGLANEIAQSRPHLFSSTAVFVAPEQLSGMAAVVGAVMRVAALPEYRREVLSRAPAIAQRDPGPVGVFMGFDFHLGEEGASLIEINTNAGGPLLNLALARAQQACCQEREEAFRPSADLARLDHAFFAMFLAEWRRARGDSPLRRVAIVDDDPASQYLHPEFQLFERLFHRFGVSALIADPRELEWREGRLWCRGESIDLVYNRLTDFYLEAEHHTALRSAYEADGVVVTPHPFAHALYADKRNLVVLSDPVRLTELGVTRADRDILLLGIPRTERVEPSRAEELWGERRRLFFKPASGFGSRAAYRGDKLTRRVWEETILTGEYVAQSVAPPSERLVALDGSETGLKLDVRAYVYDGSLQLLAARLYSGQTTNFRTPGGGFAPVLVAAGQ